MAETFHGYIETTQDVLLIFEGCRRGLIPRVCRRLQEKERRMIRSGSVFVFDERESGIKRWTDGLVWSPSRILGNFLIYRELDKRVPGDKKLYISSASSTSSMNDARQRSYSADQTGIMTSGMSNDRNRERRLVGSLSDSYRFRKDGFIKKTMSIIVNGVAQHLISYYLPNDIISNKLRTPSSVPELASLEISPDLLVKQNFRIPPMVEPPFDQQNDPNLTGLGGSSTGGGLSPIDNHNPYSTDDRRIHPLRSMSLGSLHRASTTNYANNIMYTTSSLSQRMDMDDDDTNKMNNNNLSAYYNNQQQPQYSQNGFPPLPSPSSMTTSSPNTPMLSPVRQSFSSQPSGRHYSMSSTTSSSGPTATMQQQRFSSQNNRNSFDINSIHPHMVPEVTYDQRTSRAATENNNASPPNIGQLLNPVHPHVKSEPHQSNDNVAQQQQQLFQSMDYGDYSTTKLPSIPQQQQQQQQQQNNDFTAATYGGNYYIQRPQQQHQPLANTHSISVVTNNIVPMFRNGMIHPTTQPSSLYDDSQTTAATGGELGMEPLMLK